MDDSKIDSFYTFNSPRMKEIYYELERAAPTDVSILISGETGTGKEILSQMIVNMSKRKNKPYVKINCAAIPSELIESTLFGSIKGSYTGASIDSQGILKESDKGTTLLDEISEMALGVQSKLLRAVQDQTFRPVGGKKEEKSDFRIIATTNRTLNELLEKHIRGDLFYRLSKIYIEIPSLREIKSEILPLADHILKNLSTKYEKNIKGFDDETSSFIESYSWKGNIRELTNCLERAVILTDEEILKMKDFQSRYKKREIEMICVNGKEINLLDKNEYDFIMKCLIENNGNKFDTAKILGIRRTTLYNKLENMEKIGYNIPKNPNSTRERKPKVILIKN